MTNLRLREGTRDADSLHFDLPGPEATPAAPDPSGSQGGTEPTAETTFENEGVPPLTVVEGAR